MSPRFHHGFPVASVIALGACVTAEPDGRACREASAGDPFVDCVESFDPGLAEFGHDDLPDVVVGPPGGLFHVASLGCEGTMVVRFLPPHVADGPGADFIVFENPFDVGFPEAAEVSVSLDGSTWHTFPCDALTLEGCAGRTPTWALPGSEVSATDPAVAGGDAFDIADVGLDEVRFVRLVDRSRPYWETLGMDFCEPGNRAGGFDLDAIAAVYVAAD